MDQIMKVAFIGFLLIIFMFIIFLIAVVGPYVSKFGGVFSSTLSTTVTSLPTSNNESQVGGQVIGSINTSLASLDWLAYIFIFLMVVIMISMCFTVRAYPWLLGVWIGLIVLCVIVAIFITNVYITISTNSPDVYKNWKDVSYTMQYLPHFIVALGILGGIIMFTLISKDPEGERLYQ